MEEQRHQAYELAQYQSLPLEAKVRMTQRRIEDWYNHFNGDVYVSFSGGKDSTVLLHLVRELYPEVPAVFSDTGLEYPEIKAFAKSHDNVIVVRPKMGFKEVIRTHGYPIISKEVSESIKYARKMGGVEYTKRTKEKNSTDSGHLSIGGGSSDNLIDTSVARNRRTVLLGQWHSPEGTEKSMFNKEKWLPVARDLPVMISNYCCNVMKKQPIKQFQHKNKLFPFIGTLAEESLVRKQAWMRHGCNAFDSRNPSSQPMSFWTEQDVLTYIAENNIPICSVYGDIVYKDQDGMEYEPNELTCGKLQCTGCQRTGCVFCGYGAHLDKVPRFRLLKETHPQLYRYCINGGEWRDNPNYVPGAPEYDGEWKNWNPKKVWMPSIDGLGFGKVFDMINELYGKEIYKF